MEYEYDTVTHVTELKPGWSDASKEDVGKITAQSFGTAMRVVWDVAKDEGWEIVSHSITRLDRWWVTAFLLRRPVRDTGNGQSR